MTFARGVFIFAFVMLIVGAVGARLIIGPLLFGNVNSPSYAVQAHAATATPTLEPSPSPSKAPVEHVVPTNTPAPTAAPTPRLTASSPALPRSTRAIASAPRVSHHARRPQASAGPLTHAATARRALARHGHRPAPTATAHATPVPSPTPSGVVTLTNYWVGSTTTHPGTTIAVGYVIDNRTGATAHVQLGASVKASSRLSWATDSISDPGHDVVAVVPPGISRHVRYFTLSRGLRSGSYDIAWGLRNPSTGARVALVAAQSALRVQRIIPAP